MTEEERAPYLFTLTDGPRFVYRQQYSRAALWPAPLEPCIHCKRKGWPPSWAWNGYHWQCRRKHRTTKSRRRASV